MNTNDVVTISPEHSLKFANKQGVIKEIVPTKELSLKIQFTSGGRFYWFSPDEVISLNT